MHRTGDDSRGVLIMVSAGSGDQRGMRSSRHLLPRLVGAVIAVLGFASAAPAASAQNTKTFGDSRGAFHVDCAFSHRAPDDPIVFPAQPGAAHSHDFVGSPTTNAFSSPTTLRLNSSTTCVRTNTRRRLVDRSAYWVPTLHVGAAAISPSGASAYYTTGFRHLSSIRTFPSELRVIAGDAQADQHNHRTQGIRTECGGGKCLIAIRFPDCWDGVRVDSADHKSHMAFSQQVRSGSPVTGCPGTHPVQMPRLELAVRYPVASLVGARLSSGSLKTFHADFMNGWEVDALAGLVRNCLAVDRYCGGQDTPVPGHP
jgi:hypothetical protein